MEEFALFNVVWYDGCDAFVSKFVLPTKAYELTSEGKKQVQRYLEGNGEVLKTHFLYTITLENLIAFRTSEDKAFRLAYDRFATMYFSN